jgi:hypothetical protein
MAARKEPKPAPPPAAATTPAPNSAAEQSALWALQAAFDEERVANLGARLRLEREVEALQARVVDLEADLAGAAARVRELEASLRARGR